MQEQQFDERRAASLRVMDRQDAMSSLDQAGPVADKKHPEPGGGAPGADEVLTPDEIRQLKSRFHLAPEVLRTAGPAQGLTHEQIEGIIEERPVSISREKRAALESSRAEMQRSLPPGVDRAEALDGGWFSGCSPTPTSTLTAPTGAELSTNSVVVAAITQSWTDSEVADATNRHEEGGWIYMDTTSGAITTRRAARGGGASINLWNPPEVSGSVVVGNWHTHPNPTSEGWEPGPSPSDTTNQARRKVPGMVRSDQGMHVFGVTRRASLSGNAGFP